MGDDAKGRASAAPPQVPLMKGSDNEIYRSFATITDMLRDRGVDASCLSHVCAEDVVASAAGRPVFHVDLPSCNTRIVYNLNARFKLNSVRKLLEEPEHIENADHEAQTSAPTPPGRRVYILVTKERPLHSVQKSLDAMGKDIQIFEVRELQFNVSRHVLVPPHTPVRDAHEVTRILQCYGLKSRHQLPLILSTDPMARYLALKPGELVRIQRPSPSAGTYTLYRCCARG